jgi:hypothetical protein
MNTTAELITEFAKHTDATAERKKKVFHMIRKEEIHSVEEVKRLLVGLGIARGE